MSFDPNATGNKNNGLFSLPFSEEESQLVIVSVPWEMTTSYGEGCALGPDAILESSRQLDVADALYGSFYKKGIFMRPANPAHIEAGNKLKSQALAIKGKLEQGEALNDEDRESLSFLNDCSQKTNSWVYEQCQSVLKAGKICAVVGGDHSAPLGLIRALKEKHENLSILQVDAHMDLRKSYQGFQYSHASIMRNAMDELKPHSLVQMGIRDFCPEEQDFERLNENIHCFYDSLVQTELAQGKNWAEICDEAIAKLSDEVYISFDIDGLSPDLCPNTGTPVPGGLSFSQMEVLLYKLSKSGKKITGFDLCEVSPGPNPENLDGWDGNVGARVLFKLCGATLSSL